MKRRPSKQQKIVIFSVSAALVLVIGYLTYQHFERYPSTDDAYVQANTVNIAAQVSGPIAQIFINDHASVKKNQPLFQIDPTPFQIGVDRAKANLASAEANLTLALQNANRTLKLVEIHQSSLSSGDEVTSKVADAKAAVALYRAELAKAQLDLSYTTVRAPAAGVITQFVLRPGNYVRADNTLFILVEQNQFWVDANFKETQLTRIRPRQTATIVLDMYPSKTFTGVVDAVNTASGSQFSLLPPENASGNWVKVTQRFPVKIIIAQLDPAFPLRVGATAQVTVDTASHYD